MEELSLFSGTAEASPDAKEVEIQRLPTEYGLEASISERLGPSNVEGRVEGEAESRLDRQGSSPRRLLAQIRHFISLLSRNH